MALRLTPIAVFLALFGCKPNGSTTSATTSTPTGPPWFEFVSKSHGLDFPHDPGPFGKYELPQIIGSGCALFDFDGDGRLDAYLVQNAGPQGPTNRLFHQEADGRFRDVSAGSGLAVAGFGMGVAVGDVNNDGKPDLVLTEYGQSRMFLNLGGGQFRDISQEAGIDNPLWGTSAAFFDYDRDGFLDLVIVNYVSYDPSLKCVPQAGGQEYCNPTRFKGTVDRLFRNKGKQADGAVRFQDVTVKAGLAAGTGNGLGVVCADFTGDGWPDIFVANDGQANRLWVNQKNGTFIDEAPARGVALTGMATTAANMGIACGDVDGDGLLDLFVTHLTDEMHTLWRQDTDGFFRDETVRMGLIGGQWRGTGFGTVIADFNRDGLPDLALANGRVSRNRAPRAMVSASVWNYYEERNQIFAGAGQGKFRDVSVDSPALCGSPNVARAMAVGDIDNDGKPDLLVTQIGGPALLFRNVAPGDGHWLGIRAIDPGLNRDALGSVITVQAGGRTFVGLVNPGGSYLCASDPRVHIGLGSIDRIDSLVVTWWNGVKEQFAVESLDRYIVLKRGEGKPLAK